MVNRGAEISGSDDAAERAAPEDRPADATAAADRSEVRHAVTRFLGAGLLAVVVVAVPAALWIRAEAESHSLSNTIAMTERLAEYSIGPLVTKHVLDGEPHAMAELDDWVRPWLADDAIVRIKIWNAEGRIVYSDVPQLVGQTFATADWWPRVLAGGTGEAQLGRRLAADNAYEADAGELLEVYVGAHAATGEALVVEVTSTTSVFAVNRSRFC